MKTKLILAGIFALTIFNCFAQNKIPKGSTLLGGDILFIRYTDRSDFNSESNSGFSIMPVFGKAIKDNLFLGLRAGIGIYKNTASNQDSYKTNEYSYGVFARKYHSIKNNFFIFLQGDLAGTNSRQTTKNVSRDYYNRRLGIGASITPGISYSINRKLQIEAGLNNIVSINYLQTKTNDNLTSHINETQSSLEIKTSLNNFTSQLYFGFRLLLQKKDKMIASK